jgi:PAS domain S-box-containing protein
MNVQQNLRGERKRMNDSAVPSEEKGYFEQVPSAFGDPVKVDPLMEQYPEIEKYKEITSNDNYEKISIKPVGRRFSENRYRAIVENSMDNIYICEAKTGRIIESNRSMQQLLGYSEEEMLNLSAFDFLDHPKKNIERYIGMVLEEGHLRVRNRRYRRKDGSLVDIEATCVLIREDGKDLLCVVSRDITERIKHERMLVDERNRAEFYLDILCHDIGNLHQGIAGFVKLCKEFEGDPYRSRNCIENIDALSLKSVNLSNNLKILAGIGLSPGNLVKIDPNRMILSSIKSVRSSIPWKKPVFKVDIPYNISIAANPVIERAFYNVIHNAVKYQTDLDPKVMIIGQKTEDGYLRISIKDRGYGIPHSLRTEVLNRDNLRKKHGGLGLLVVRTLVEKSGGLVWIEDREGGKGTVVVIELPISDYLYEKSKQDDYKENESLQNQKRYSSLPIQYL